eukprot:3334677-Amphidinium_carterae.1
MERTPKRKIKRRLILDSKESGMKRCTRRFEQMVLPRAADAIQDILELAAHREEGDTTRLLVLDFTNAFFQVPIRPDERRYFCFYHQGHYYAHVRLPQGARLSPLCWARVAALMSRLMVGMFLSTQVRGETFVDDPLFAMRGKTHQQDHFVAVIVLMWSTLGWLLSLAKA